MEHCQEFHFRHFKIWWRQSEIYRNTMKCHLKPYRGLETDREASINMLFQELRGGIRIVWEDIHRVFCKITHICSAFQRKTWTLWYSLGNMNTFLARPFNYCRDFNWKVVFFLKSINNYTLLHTAKLSMHSGLSYHGLWSFAFHSGSN